MMFIPSSDETIECCSWKGLRNTRYSTERAVQEPEIRLDAVSLAPLTGTEAQYKTNACFSASVSHNLCLEHD